MTNKKQQKQNKTKKQQPKKKKKMKEAVKQAGWTAPFCGKYLDFCNFDGDNLKFTFFPGRPNIQRTQRCF